MLGWSSGAIDNHVTEDDNDKVQKDSKLKIIYFYKTLFQLKYKVGNNRSSTVNRKPLVHKHNKAMNKTTLKTTRTN